MVDNYDYSNATAFTNLLKETNDIESVVRTEVDTIIAEDGKYKDIFAFAFKDVNCEALD